METATHIHTIHSDMRDGIVVVIHWAVFVSINIADVQNHGLNKEWNAHHLSTFFFT